MTEPSAECREVRPLLREHALGLLSEREIRRVDTHLASCAACHTALDAEFAALAILDRLPDAPPPVGLADRTLRQIRKTEAEEQTRSSFFLRWRLGGLLAVCCVLVTIAAVVLPALGRAREAARRSSCQNSLKQLDLVFKMYANEHGGLYPPSILVNGVPTLDLRSVYPEYLTEPAVLFCPNSPHFSDSQKLRDALHQNPPDWALAHQLIARQYVYLGWAVHGEEELRLLMAAPNLEPDTDVQAGGRTIYRLRNGVEKDFVKDKNNAGELAWQQSLIPVMFDNPACTPHVATGVNVVWLDGHTEFVRMGTRFPALPSVTKLFGGVPSGK